MFTYNLYWKNNDIEKYFKKYAQKWHLGNVRLSRLIKNIFRNSLGCFFKCILVKNENGNLAIES